MEISLPALIGIGLAAMFFGYFFGLFEGRGQGYRKRVNEDALERAAERAPQKQSAAMPVTVDSSQSANAGSSLLTLRRDAAGKPSLDLDGQPIVVSELTAAQRRRLIELMVLMRPWIETQTATRGISAARSPAPVSTPSLMDRLSTASGADSPPAASLIAETAPPVITPGPVIREMSLVAQINAVLQARLAGTALADRGVRLVEAPSGGVLVVVGVNRYPSVDVVPDPEIQTCIRAAIAEWEEKFAPG